MVQLLAQTEKETLSAALATKGLRLTRQREHIYSVILAERDHPTAEIIHERALESIPSISMATVYNCLETLLACGLIRQVNLNRHATRYCPFKEESPNHAHFFCEKTGNVVDINLTEEATTALKKLLPEGYEVDATELCFRGRSA